jgi:hypothetical protein
VCHVSLPSSYRSRRGHIHLLRVLPLVGRRSKTPTVGEPLPSAPNPGASELLTSIPELGAGETLTTTSISDNRSPVAPTFVHAIAMLLSTVRVMSNASHCYTAAGTVGEHAVTPLQLGGRADGLLGPWAELVGRGPPLPVRELP